LAHQGEDLKSTKVSAMIPGGAAGVIVGEGVYSAVPICAVVRDRGG
jgi:hypothetical protein